MLGFQPAVMCVDLSPGVSLRSAQGFLYIAFSIKIEVERARRASSEVTGCFSFQR